MLSLFEDDNDLDTGEVHLTPPLSMSSPEETQTPPVIPPHVDSESEDDDDAPPDDPPPLEDGSDDDVPPVIQSRRSGRIRQPTIVGLESAANIACALSASTITEKAASQDANWRRAMQAEIDSLTSLKTYEIVDRPKDRKVIPTRWVYAKKDAKHGKEQYKARLVAKGFKQVYGLDYDLTWAPTARGNSLRLIVALAARDRSHIRHIDIVPQRKPQAPRYLCGTSSRVCYNRQGMEAA